MGIHLWSEANAELQNMFDTKVFGQKYKKELLQKVLLSLLEHLAEPKHPPTHLTSTS